MVLAPVRPKQAWGGALDEFKAVGLPAGAKLRNVGAGFPLPVRPPSAELDIPALLTRIQQHVFQRRLRVKDAFKDYDQLRCGRCTRQQFIRGVNSIAPSFLSTELEALAEYYTEEGPHVQRPQVVSYTRFVAAIEEVFTVAQLEKQPTRKVPRAGATLQHVFRPNSVGVDNEEARIEGILKKIALLCKTRGVVFLACFQDCERSDATSLVTPRYSGKVTPAQFHQHFPLIGDFEPKEMLLLVKRYMNGNGDINYQALDRDIKEAALLVPPPAGAHTAGKRVPQTPRSPSTGKQVSSTRYRREVALQETLQSVDVMEKLKAVVSERRLRLADCFADFDKLRKGFCTVNQLRTVFTVLGIELSNNDYASLAELFCNQEGLFCYREFCNAVCEIHALNLHSWDMELPTTPSTNREDCRPGSRIRYKAPLDESAQDRQAELEIRIKKRADVRSLNLKRCFQDFDRVCAGHVTRLQFHRIMDMLHCELSSDDADTLCQAYCDTDNGQEFNYIDFCDSVKQYGIVGEQTPIAVTVSRRPKYFDRSGESITPYTPVQMNTGPYPEDVHSGVLPWSRPCTR